MFSLFNVFCGQMLQRRRVPIDPANVRACVAGCLQGIRSVLPRERAHAAHAHTAHTQHNAFAPSPLTHSPV